MSRRTLPQTQGAASGAAFFPSLQKEMNRLLDQFKTGFPVAEDTESGLFSGAMFPALDMIETDDAVEITAELPGVAEADLDVTVNGNTLVLKGEKKSEHEEKEDAYHLIERRYGSFRRQVDLGFAPETGDVDAGFADGILKVIVAKPEKVRNDVQRIAIKKS